VGQRDSSEAGTDLVGNIGLVVEPDDADVSRALEPESLHGE